jgi:hypothetical protein
MFPLGTNGTSQHKLRIMATTRTTLEPRLSAVVVWGSDSKDILYRNAAEISRAVDMSDATSTSIAAFFLMMSTSQGERYY